MTAEKATRILSGYCSLMLAPTEKVRAMLNRYGVSCPVVTVPTGIDLTAFGLAQDNGEEKARMRAELGIPEGDTVLLSHSRRRTARGWCLWATAPPGLTWKH